MAKVIAETHARCAKRRATNRANGSSCVAIRIDKLPYGSSTGLDMSWYRGAWMAQSRPPQAGLKEPCTVPLDVHVHIRRGDLNSYIGSKFAHNAS